MAITMLVFQQINVFILEYLNSNFRIQYFLFFKLLLF